MKFSLILVLLYSFVCATTCLPDLQNICNEDVFDYENKKINSFFNFKFNNTIPELNQLLISNSLNFDDWSHSQKKVKEILEKKDVFNNVIKNFYTETNFNIFNSSDILRIRNSVVETKDYFFTWSKKINSSQKIVYDAVQNTLNLNYDLFGRLFLLKNNRINEKIIPPDVPIYLLMGLEEELNGTGVTALGDLSDENFLFRFFSERIFKFNNITLDSKILKDDPEFVNSLSIYIPVSKFNYNPNDSCAFALGLPEFYKEYNLKFSRN